MSEVSHIAEFGHNPMQLFEKPHSQFEDKQHDYLKTVFDPFARTQAYVLK